MILLSVFHNLSPVQQASQMDYSAFVQDVQQDRVESVVIADQTIEGKRLDGTSFQVVRPSIPDLDLINDL